MDEKRLKQEYQNWKRQSAPDLWNRIEEKLKDYPERETEKYAQYTTNSTIHRPISQKVKRRIFYGAAVSFAAVICLTVSMPGLYKGFMVKKEEKITAYETTAYENVPRKSIAAETNAWTSAAEESKAQASAAEENKAQTGAAEENKAQAGAAEESEAQAGAATENAESKTHAAAALTKNTLRVPENALAVSENSAYFSQAVLADTELLCTGIVNDVSLEYDDQGRAVKVVYQLSLEQIHYAQDYLTGAEQITVKSPIVKAEGDEVYLLYQMKKEKTYLLPLKKTEGNWELIYPFAPQIQFVNDQSYLFHSGYISLINEKTQVVEGEQEGENDYFYDRMLLREDENFLADFLRLVEEQVNAS